MVTQRFLETLPLAKTADLPQGTLFWAPRAIYEVVAHDKAGYGRARQWQGDEKTDVALVPRSPLAARLPVVAQGRVLPVYPSREALLQHGSVVSFVFPIERGALDVATLDARFCGANTGLYVRRYERYPAFEVTNGLNVYRRYYYTRTNQNLDTNLGRVKDRLRIQLIPHTQGPMTWRLLHSWDERPYDDQPTVAMRTSDLLGSLDKPAQTTQHSLKRFRPPAEDDDSE